MREQFFMEQIGRLQSRFGEKAFDPEFTKLVAVECITMQEQAFLNLVSFFIGSRPMKWPPLIGDFREGRINEEKKGFKRDVDGAAEAVYGNSFPATQDPKRMPEILAPTFPGCKSVKEALEVAKFKLQVKNANQDVVKTNKNALPFDFNRKDDAK